MEKYIIVERGGDTVDATIAEHRGGGQYKELSAEQVLALLNTPPTPTPSTGIVWRKPGEAGREHYGIYMVWVEGRPSVLIWKENDVNDGWLSRGVTAWAEITPPAWEGEKA
jgi:hypothetical protein